MTLTSPREPDPARALRKAQLLGLYRERRFAELAQLARTALQFDPDDGFTWNALGSALGQLGQADAAIEALRCAATLLPGDVGVHSNLGAALLSRGHNQEAEGPLRVATRLRPGHADAWSNLGIALRRQGRMDEALASCRQALACAPPTPAAWTNLGLVYLESGQAQPASEAFLQALSLAPEDPLIRGNLSAALLDLGRADDAWAQAQQALRLAPEHATLHLHAALAALQAGEVEQALAHQNLALEQAPDNLAALSNLLLTLNYRPVDDAHYLAIARRYGTGASQAANPAASEVASQAASHAASQAASHAASQAASTATSVAANTPRPGIATAGNAQAAPPALRGMAKPDRLRVGLVSGDLRNHAVGHFLESTLQASAGLDIDWIAYASIPQKDELTVRLQRHLRQWRDIAGMDDARAADLIRADGNHVLLDLSGHTGHGRTALFAHRPAPVQASWLGYFSSTGIEQMDYFIADPHLAPEGAQVQFTERLWRLPHTRMCFTPPGDDISVGSLPCLAGAPFTFACFNALAKIGDEVIATWAQVLQQVPASRLWLKSIPLASDTICARTAARFARYGIGAERLLLEGPSPRAQYLAAYHRADIALDPFPFTGGTTSAEALWMGVPVVTLQGRRLVERQGAAFQRLAGLDDWIASDRDDYIARAVHHAADRQALQALRGRLRGRIAASPVCDAQRFARDLRDALWQMCQDRGMWRTERAD